MLFLKVLGTFVGTIAVLLGLVWLAQGTGLLHWPSDSSMIEDRGWAIRGAVMIAAGSVLLWLTRCSFRDGQNGDLF